MLTGDSLVAVLRETQVTHVVWIPDSEIGKWETALLGEGGLPLIRVAREGEAIGVAAGLLIGGKFPLVIMQCTGLFEAGDALRNVVHDLRLPLAMIVGVRSMRQAQKGTTSDTCPQFAQPIMDAWRIPYRVAEPESAAENLRQVLQAVKSAGQAHCFLLPE